MGEYALRQSKELRAWFMFVCGQDEAKKQRVEGDLSSLKCFRCKAYGHYIADCPQKE